MTIRRDFKEERRQIVFYPTIKLVSKIDALVKSEEGKNSRAYILEMLIEDWFERVEKEKDNNET